jgi:hypothetical protein
MTTSEQFVDSWAERAKHIDDHFMGRNGRTPRMIQEWVHAEHDYPDSSSEASGIPFIKFDSKESPKWRHKSRAGQDSFLGPPKNPFSRADI